MKRIKPLVLISLTIAIVFSYNSIYDKSGANYLIRVFLMIPLVVLTLFSEQQIYNLMPAYPPKRVFNAKLIYSACLVLFLMIALLIDWQQFKLLGTPIDPLCRGSKGVGKWLPFSYIPGLFVFWGLLRRIQKR